LFYASGHKPARLVEDSADLDSSAAGEVDSEVSGALAGTEYRRQVEITIDPFKAAGVGAARRTARSMKATSSGLAGAMVRDFQL